MVEAAVSDPFDGGEVDEGSAVVVVRVRAWFWVRCEDETKRRHWFCVLARVLGLAV